MRASIIIRVKNEAENLRKTLKILKNQTLQDFELIIVNDNSTDGSEKVAFKFFPRKRITVINVPPGKFTYPYASNLGAKVTKGKYLVYLSAHSYPISNTWLADGLSNFDTYKIAGIFAVPLPHEDEKILEKTLYLITVNLYPKHKIYTSYRSGVLGTTNAIIRKDLWKKHQFNERWSLGGEDAEWASYFMEKGYEIVQDARFRVRHSHHQGSLGHIKQRLLWKSLRAQVEKQS